MADLNVLHVVPTFLETGVGVVASELSDELRSLGVNSLVIGFSRGPSPKGPGYVAIKVSKVGIEEVTYLAILVKKLSQRFDILHFHGPPSGLSRVLSVKKPIVYTCHGPGTHLRSVYLEESKRLGMISPLHYALGHLNIGLLKLLSTPMYVMADSVVAVSDFVAEKLIELGVPREKVAVIHNGVNIDKLYREAGVEDAEHIEEHRADAMLFVRPTPRKGLHFVILSLALVAREMEPGYRIVVIGHVYDEYRRMLMRIAEQRGVAKLLEFKGFVSRRELLGWYRRAKLLLFGSLGEPFATVILESMSLCTPVVAFKSGGVGDVIIDGYNGYAVPPLDLATYAKRVLDVLTNEELYRRLSRNAVQTIKQNFTSKIMARKYLKIYQKLA